MLSLNVLLNFSKIMRLLQLVLQTISWLQNVLLGLIKNTRSKKTAIFVALIVIFFLYTLSSYLLPAHRHFHVAKVHERPHKTRSCLKQTLTKFRLLMKQNNAIIKEHPGSTIENRFFPFTGNGLFGLSLDETGAKLFYLDTKAPVDIPFAPVVEVRVKELATRHEQFLALDLQQGTIHRLTGYHVNRSCVVVEETFYLHRIHESLLIQSIEVSNEGQLPIHVELSAPTKNASNVVSTKYVTEHGKLDSVHSVSTAEGFEYVKITTAISNYQSLVQVPQKSHNRVDVIAVTKVTYGPAVASRRGRKSPTVADNDVNMQKKVGDELVHVIGIKPDTLIQQHTKTWNEMWKSGVSISSDYDPDSPTPLHVNLTEYYIYTTTHYNLSVNVPHMDCFSGPPTIRNAALWVMPSTIERLYQLKKTWRQLFQASGCLSADVTSFLAYRQAMTLSFLGLQYQRHHLQLSFNPLNLRSNISVRSLSLDWFKSRDLLSLELSVSHDEQKIHVASIGKHTPPIYICPTACKQVVVLGGSVLTLPVFTTDPVTPLLYISDNKTHLEKLGNTPFMRMALENAKASHQHYLEAHHLKLSPKFWLAIVVLIVTFHVIVIKMIYNECRTNRETNRRRTPYD